MEFLKSIKELPIGSLEDMKKIISEKYNNEFTNKKIHIETFTKLDRLCYWDGGEYLFNLKVHTSKPYKIFEQSWKFTLTEKEVNRISLNVIKILSDTCSVASIYQYNFAYPKYETIK